VTGETNENVTCGCRPQCRLAPEGLSHEDLARWCRRQRREFYERLAALVDMPTRPTASQGIAWPASGNCWLYNSLIVLPYLGDFDHPGRYSPCWTIRGAPIPRIHLNHISWYPPQAQQFRWAGERNYDRRAAMSGHELELTVDIRELVDFAPWVLGWLEAVEKGNASLMPTPPHRLEGDTRPQNLLRTCYEWTLAAYEDYHARHQENEQYERRRAEWRERMSRQAGQELQPKEVTP